MSKKPINPVVYRRNANIGAADAEADQAFLLDCFVDTGDLGTLMNCNNSQCIVVGRTGAGKTALLKELLRRAEHAIELCPDTMALSYIANSQAIAFYEAAGVHMEMFYKAMWQHVLVIELLKLKYDVRNEQTQADMFTRLFGMFRNDRVKGQAMDYMQNFGGMFWRESAERTRNIVDRVESEMKGAAKVDAGKLALGAEGARRLTHEERGDVMEVGERAVSKLQLEKLNAVLRLLSEDVFTDEKNNYFVVIDRLDENWVTDPLRFKLIRALIEAVRTLRQVSNVKVVFSLRDDLLYSVLERTGGPGFQREKFSSLYLKLRWSRDQIVDLLDRRINVLFKRQYTRENVSLQQILPGNQLHRRTMVDYIVERTFMRPREAIMFVNECIAQADGQTKITKAVILQAEGVYSPARLDALVDEWGAEFPNLAAYLEPLRRRITPIALAELGDEALEPMCLKLMDKRPESEPLFAAMNDYYIEHKLDRMAFLRQWLKILYMFGVVGIKANGYYPRMWSHEHEQKLPVDLIDDQSSIDVHKAYWRELGVRTKHYSGEE